MKNWLNLYVPLNETGFGTHGYNWARQMSWDLTSQGVNVCVIPIGGQISRPELRKQPVDAGLDTALMNSLSLQDRMDFSAPSVNLWHPNNMAQFGGKPRIGYTVWETTKLTDREIHHLDNLDYIVVPTQWHRELIWEQIPETGDQDRDNVLVWPEGVDQTKFHPNKGKGSMAEGQDDVFTFVNAGKWETRKGCEVLATAVGSLAVLTDQPFRLIGCWGNPWMNQQDYITSIENAYGRVGFGRAVPTQTSIGPGYRMTHRAKNIEVLFYNYLPNHQAVVDVYRAADAGVFPFFAEGWGLSITEMMAMGKPIVATQWGAPLEYLQNGNYYPISNGQEAQAYDGKWFRGNRGNWYQVSAGEVTSMMRTVMEDEDREKTGMKGATYVLENYTWADSTKIAVEDLQSLAILDLSPA